MPRRITIRLTDAEFARISGEADTTGLTMAELCRRKLFGRTIKPRLSQTDAEAVTALNRIGGLLKQLFKRERIDGHTAYDMLTELKHAVRQLRG